jgi:hypothetical protein
MDSNPRTRLRGGHDGNRGWLLDDCYRRREARQGGKGKEGLGRGGGHRKVAREIERSERWRAAAGAGDPIA